MEDYVEILDEYGSDNEFLPNLIGKPDIVGDRIWTDFHGYWHREDGPAFINHVGGKLFYINDNQMTKDEWLQYLKSGQSSLDQKTLNRIILEYS